MEIGQGMIGTSLAAVLALVAPAPESLMPQETPYYASSPASPVITEGRILSDQDTVNFRQGLTAARARDAAGARAAMARINDPAARRLVEWALLDTSAGQMSASEVSAAVTSFAGWPRGDSRRQAAERLLGSAYAGPDATIAMFERTGPVTAQGAVALAEALEQRGR